MGGPVKDILLAAIPATIPTLAVLVGILLNQTGINRLGGKIGSLENRLEGKIGSLENRLEGRIGSLEVRLDGRINSLADEIVSLRKQLHDDIVMLVGRDTDKSERLARLEERSKG